MYRRSSGIGWIATEMRRAPLQGVTVYFILARQNRFGAANKRSVRLFKKCWAEKIIAIALHNLDNQ